MIRRMGGILIVTGVLVVADIASSTTPLKFLLLPPFGALSYLVFVNPGGVNFNFRRIVVCPCATAALAFFLAGTLGYNPLSIALGTLGTVGIMRLLDAHMIVPPLALELLTLLLHDQIRGQSGYLVSIVAFTCLLYALYLLWRRLPVDGEPNTAASPEAC